MSERTSGVPPVIFFNLVGFMSCSGLLSMSVNLGFLVKQSHHGGINFSCFVLYSFFLDTFGDYLLVIISVGCFIWKRRRH